jgi:DNA repair exonuclease SbcCD nuclease subunit
MIGDKHHRSQASRELIIAHSSDLHLGSTPRVERELVKLRLVLDAAEECGARALVLAGDVFDSHRAVGAIVEGAARMLAAAPVETVILPGNHDPATDDAVYRRFGFCDPEHVHVLGVSAEEHVQIPALDLEITGLPHVAYADYAPLARSRERTMRWHVVVAHGHYVTGPQDAHRGWQIHDHQIAATGADYVALGHWDVAQPAGDGAIPAYYSGSPDLSRTVNIVRFSAEGIDVRRHPLRIDGA